MFPFCSTAHNYREMNAAHRSPNEYIDPLGSLWNQARAGPFMLAGNTLHMRRSLPALRIIVWLKCSIWSYGSVVPSYIPNDNIRKGGGGGGGSYFRICGPTGEDNISSSPRTVGKETKYGAKATLNE